MATTLTEYKNPFFKKDSPYSRRSFEVDPKAIEYNGFTIHQYSRSQFHCVKDGICMGMSGSVDNCKKRIDSDDFNTFYDLHKNK